MKRIAAHFHDELRAAGLNNGVSAEENGNIAFTGVSEEDKKAVYALLDAHDPNDPLALAAEDARKTLAETDQKMVRVIEDLIDVLVVKGVITSKDLPKAAQDRIAARRTARKSL